MNEQIKKLTDSLTTEQIMGIFIGTLYGLADIQGIDRDKFVNDYIDNFLVTLERELNNDLPTRFEGSE